MIAKVIKPTITPKPPPSSRPSIACRNLVTRLIGEAVRTQPRYKCELFLRGTL
jgi:hypothetical protein